MKQYQVAIIGGGASGLALATMLSRQGCRDILVLDRNDRMGKKLSATGNGQGNVTNLHMDETHYFSSDLKKVGHILRQFDEQAAIRFLTSLGGLFLADERGRVYPASRQASSVTDLFRYYLDGRVELRTNARVVSIANHTVRLETGERIQARYIVCCVGGKAAKQFGTDGTSYALAQELGHSLTPLYPALVQLKTDTARTKTWRGIRVDGVLHYGKIAVRGDVIFTEYGISGDAVFRMSSYLAGKKAATLSLEFLPEVPQEQILSLLRQKNVPSGEQLCGIVNNQIGRSLVRLGQTPEQMVSLLKGFELSVSGTLDFSYAQVTRGGIPMQEVTDALESQLEKDVFFCGEVLDVDGLCGGYNLQWAFASAAAVAREIVCRH